MSTAPIPIPNSAAHSGSLHKRKKSQEGDTSRKRPSTTSWLQPINPFFEDVGDADSRQAGDGDDFYFLIPPEGCSVSTEPLYSIGHGVEDTRIEETPSIPASNACNPTLPLTQNPGAINTGGGAYFDGAHITGGSHAFGTSSVVNNINNALMVIQSGDGEFTEDQRNLVSEYIANLAVFPDINNHLNRHFLTQLIINLPRAEAMFNDYQTKKKSGPCFDGTRVALLREMADWVTSTGESRLYVLSGLAGIGKSTVAYTIASRAADLNLLGASFFFSRDEADRKNAKKFFTTIAFQLCVYNETFSNAIGDTLLTEHGSAATTKDPQEQLQTLIVDPLRDIVRSSARPVLLVVDALDECEEKDALSVLTALRRLVQVLPSFKVILTTRPQQRIDRFFANQYDHKIFYLQDIEDKIVDKDIQLYLKHSLSAEQVKHYFQRSQWCANDEEIDAIVHAAGRLFIIASTSIRYIFDEFVSNPAAQMQKLLRTFSQDRVPFKDLDHFYSVILRNLVPVDCDNHDIVARYQSVVGAIIFIQSPLSVTTLAHLIKIDVEEIRIVLDKLQSVILLGDDDVPRIYHKSFPDFISDSKRCQEPNLRIDARTCHTWISICCFEIMDKHLEYNILGLGNPARFMSNEDGLAKQGITPEQLEENIPQQLQYTCVYWANHLEVANIENARLMKELEGFANKHMLPWFEALSLAKKLDSARRALRIVVELLKPTPSDLCQLLSDGLRFILKFYEIIERSALHTYYSALVFTPKDCLLYRRYHIKWGIHNMCHVIGGPDRWDALIAYLDHGEAIDDIQFSLDNTMLASRSREALRVWDAATGTLISTINGRGFAIANDFSIVAAINEDTITLSNVNGSEQGATFTAQKGMGIVRMAISPDNNRIAAISSNGTLCLWNSENGELISSCDEFSAYYQEQDRIRDRNRDFLQFCATGARLAYMTANGVGHLRNGIDGRFIAYLDRGSERVKFSLDGSRIARVAYYTGLKLWSCDDGGLIGIAEDDDDPWNLAISSNGSLLATCGHLKIKVKLWSGNSGNPLPLIDVLDLDQFVHSLAFSPDDTLLAIATATDIRLYDIKDRSFTSTLLISSYNLKLAFSPDSTRLAAWSSNTVYLSDMQLGGIEAASDPSFNTERASIILNALALSMDCSRVACGFWDGKIELWEIDNRTKQQIVTQRHHRRLPVQVLGFSPDGKQLASGSDDGAIKLWDGEHGTLHGRFQYLCHRNGILRAVGVSDSVLAAAGDNDLVLWDHKTLDHIYTFTGIFRAPLSFSANGALLATPSITFDGDVKPRFSGLVYRFPIGLTLHDDDATANDDTSDDDTTSNTDTISDDDTTPDDDTTFHRAPDQLMVFDVARSTCIATFKFQERDIQETAFLPENSYIVAQPSFGDDFLTFDRVNEEVSQGPIFEHFIHLPNMPLWQDVPVWVASAGNWQCIMALFSPHDDPVPVLRIPREFNIWTWAQRRSMIIFGCEDGRLLRVFPQQPTNHVV